MKTPGRPRSSKNTPTHINVDKLPDRVWFNAAGNGRWMLTFYDDLGKKHAKRLCAATATLPEIWQAVESQTPKTITTFASLSLDFETTHRWQKLSKSTQRDYTDCRKSIINRLTTKGQVGSLPIADWTIGFIRKYRDKRATESESRANKELSYIKLIFSWAYEYEKVPSNPATGIKKLTIAPRQHYADDRDYYYLLNTAKSSGYWYVQYAMELAYLCRMRMSEVLDLSDANELENGLIIHRRKGSKTNITEWQPRLTAAWQALKQKRNSILTDRKQPLPIKADRRFMFISERTGNRIDITSFKTAIQRVGNAAKKQAEIDGVDYTPFTFHDLKRKGISDTPVLERMSSAGHRSPEMMRVYDVLPDIVKPTK